MKTTILTDIIESFTEDYDTKDKIQLLRDLQSLLIDRKADVLDEISDMCFDYCCPSTSYDVFGSFFIDSEIHCLWNRWMFENSIILMDKYTKENNQTFKNYLDNQCNFKKYFPEGGETNV